jgi:5-methylcytosine-specific restriction endonuclease McrA
MLREDKRARHSVRRALLGRRYRFETGALAGPPLRARALAAAATLQQRQPLQVLEHERRRWWWFRDRFYWEDEGLSAEDVHALLVERERRKRRQLERAHANLAREQEAPPRREPIPRALRLTVWERDGGRCVECESDFELQFDHVIPLTLGGATSAENLQLLCASCNRAKGGSL